MNDVNSTEQSQLAALKGVSKEQQARASAASKAAEARLPDGKDQPSAKAASTDSRSSGSAPVADERSVDTAVESLNNYVQSLQRDLRFTVDQDLGRTVVRVVESDSNRVVRQIPTETALQLARNLKEHATQRELEAGLQVGKGPGSRDIDQITESSISFVNTKI